MLLSPGRRAGVVFPVVEASKIVVCGGREERRKVVVVVLPLLLSGLPAAAGGHDSAYKVKEKLSVLKGMMIMLWNCCWRRERELPLIVERGSCWCFWSFALSCLQLILIGTRRYGH